MVKVTSQQKMIGRVRDDMWIDQKSDSDEVDEMNQVEQLCPSS